MMTLDLGNEWVYRTRFYSRPGYEDSSIMTVKLVEKIRVGDQDGYVFQVKDSVCSSTRESLKVETFSDTALPEDFENNLGRNSGHAVTRGYLCPDTVRLDSVIAVSGFYVDYRQPVGTKGTLNGEPVWSAGVNVRPTALPGADFDYDDCLVGVGLYSRKSLWLGGNANREDAEVRLVKFNGREVDFVADGAPSSN
jgi:hypothetical protein